MLEKLIPIAIADLRAYPGKLAGAAGLAKSRGASLLLITAGQAMEPPGPAGLGCETLVEWSPTLPVNGLDASCARFLVEMGELGEFARWARGRLGNMEALIRVAREDEADVECCLVPHLEAIPGLAPVLCPVSDSPSGILGGARRLLALVRHPVALLPLDGRPDPDGLTIVFSSLMETGRVHSFLVPGRDPVESAAAASSLLNALELRRFGLNYVSCPTCGRCEIPLEEIVGEVRARTAHIATPLDVAIMGCVVNGPGESKHADLGIAGGRSGGVLIKNGEVVGKLRNEEFVSRLVDEIHQMARERGEEVVLPGEARRAEAGGGS